MNFVKATKNAAEEAKGLKALAALKKILVVNVIKFGFNLAKKFRTTLEVNHGQGKSSGLDSTSTNVVLRFGLIQDMR
jgi:hypothetical protein